VLLAITFEAPKGAVLDFAVLFAVILFGPLVVERAHLPGLIGLLVGGFVIGPNGLNLVAAGDQTVPALGQFGLLYLMFAAGLELDLGLLRAYRRAAVTFGLVSFVLPFLAGLGIGFALGWSTPAAFLLGALAASHTLIVYPTVRDAGVGRNPAVATAVGATVLTDTLALIVLAIVAGTQTGSGSAADVLIVIVIGLVVLIGVAIGVLPRLAAAAIKLWAGDRVARYLVAVLSFLLMAMLAEVFGIEGIVGAFFAGLALNVLIPNEGPSMGHIEFFGSAVFIPVFLVSVGLLINPSVMFSAPTVGLAVLLCLGCIGSKAVASGLMGVLLGFSRSESGSMFVLTVPQAAATLAATLVGFQIGLFGTTVVNAVLILILVTILVATLLAPHFLKRMSVPARLAHALGRRVLLAARSPGPSEGAVRAVELLARPDGGVADVVITLSLDEPPLLRATVDALERRVFRGAIDGQIRVVHDRVPADAVLHAMLGSNPSLVVIDGAEAFGSVGEVAGNGTPLGVPVLALHGSFSGPVERVWIVEQPDGGVVPALAAEVARRLARGAPDTPATHSTAPAGTVLLTPVTSLPAADALPPLLPGCMFVFVAAADGEGDGVDA
jgi:Kef-type K+ transport system membrane component KefB